MQDTNNVRYAGGKGGSKSPIPVRSSQSFGEEIEIR
jgi:hypothetical protein